ncbi:MAG: poly-beta-1,6-N-acetyl-D-glucosamine N-deacetylase PgaB, partial [Deltaproteobacteria bacterium]
MSIAAFPALVLSVFIISNAHAVLYKQDKPYYSDIGQFNYARFLSNEGGHKAAAREFGRLIENFPGSPLIPEAQLRMGEAYLSAGMLADAEAQLKLFLANFPESPLATEAYQLYGQARASSRLTVLEERPKAVESAKGGGVPLIAVQVMFFEGRSYKEIDAELKRLKDAGINTVIARVFHNKGDRFYKVAGAGAGSLPSSGVYFRTSHAPVVADVLSELTTLAHKNGLKLFAWMTTRYADYGVEGDTGITCIGYDIASGKYARCKGLDLFSDEAVARLEAIYSDLASYDIDGILFQDDLILRHNEGFGKRAEALFKKDTGLNADPTALYIVSDNGATVHYTPLFWKWAAWKNTRLLNIAGRLKTAARGKNPSVKFAINLMYESVTNPPYALAWLSQSLESAVESG